MFAKPYLLLAVIFLDDEDSRYVPASLRKHWRAAELESLSTLTAVHFTIGKGDFDTHLAYLPFLPDSVRTLVFELNWRPGEEDDAEAFIDGLEPTSFDDALEQGLEKIVFMPHQQGQELDEAFLIAICDCLADLDDEGLLEFAPFCRQLKGCLYPRYRTRPRARVRDGRLVSP